MKNFLRACLFFLLLLPASTVAAQEIVILGNDYSVPKIYLEDGRPKGILVDIADAVSKRMKDVSFNILLYPWARAYHMATEGRGGLIGLSKTNERLALFDYSDVAYYDEVVIVVLRGREFPFKSMRDMKGKVVGIGLGGSFGEEFEQGVKSGLFMKEEDSGPVQRLKKLLAGRIDCALINPGVFALHEAVSKDAELTRRKSEFVVLPVPFKRDPNYLGFAKSMRMGAFIAKFNAALAQCRNDGEIDRIIARWNESASQ